MSSSANVGLSVPNAISIMFGTSDFSSAFDCSLNALNFFPDFFRFLVIPFCSSNSAEIKKCLEVTGADGVMIGRGVFGNPWFFSGRENADISIEERLNVLIEHTQLFEKELSKPKHKSFAVMKKHFKAYVNDFPGAKELRIKLMETENATGVRKIIDDFLKKME